VFGNTDMMQLVNRLNPNKIKQVSVEHRELPPSKLIEVLANEQCEC
jgi:hypothetical protein